MKKNSQYLFLCAAVLTGALAGCAAAAISLATDDESMFDAFVANQRQTYGAANPAAPAETAQYGFMIGEWTCDDRSRSNGEWITVRSRAVGEYALNGFAIINRSYTPEAASMMLYQYDPEAARWKIINSRAPGVAWTDWTGEKVGNSMVASRASTSNAGDPITLRISFSEIGDSSFQWSLEAVNESGGAFLVREKSCRRVS